MVSKTVTKALVLVKKGNKTRSPINATNRKVEKPSPIKDRLCTTGKVGKLWFGSHNFKLKPMPLMMPIVKSNRCRLKLYKRFFEDTVARFELTNRTKILLLHHRQAGC